MVWIVSRTSRILCSGHSQIWNHPVNTLLLVVTLLAWSHCAAGQTSANHLHISFLFNGTTCVSENSRGEFTVYYSDILFSWLFSYLFSSCGSENPTIVFYRPVKLDIFSEGLNFGLHLCSRLKTQNSHHSRILFQIRTNCTLPCFCLCSRLPGLLLRIYVSSFCYVCKLLVALNFFSWGTLKFLNLFP